MVTTAMPPRRPGSLCRKGSRIARLHSGVPEYCPARATPPEIARSGGSIRFRPKRHASNDQAPGPIIARLAPRTANTAGSSALAGSEKAVHASIIATRIPATRVHRPANSRIPASAPILCGTTVPQTGARCTQVKKKWTSAIPGSSRCAKRPPPGQPPAKVEKSLAR
jgi:hypothetical protein